MATIAVLTGKGKMHADVVTTGLALVTTQSWATTPVKDSKGSAVGSKGLRVGVTREISGGHC